MSTTTKIRMAIALAILISALGFNAGVHAQGPDPTFERVLDLGVPLGQTFLQDYLGFLWIGSAGGGLFRYDGYELQFYGAGPGELSNGYVYGLLEDASHPEILWIGTKEGLNRFDRSTGTFTYYRHDPENPNSLSNDAINILVQDGEDPHVIWIATEGGLNKFDTQTETFTRYVHEPGAPRGLPCPEVWRLIEDRANPNTLWVGSWGCGLGRFDKTEETFTFFTHIPDDTKSLGAEDNIISTLIQDKDDPTVLWIGTVKNGIDRFDQRTETFRHYQHDSQNPHTIPEGIHGLIYDDGRGKLWIGGWIADNGLTLFDKKAQTFTNYRNDPNNLRSLSDNSIVNVYEDRTGILWIVSNSGKVDKVDPNRKPIALYQHHPNQPDSLVGNTTTILYEDQQKRVWIGTTDGLARFDQSTETFVNYRREPANPASLRTNYILDLLDDGTGKLWVALWTSPLTKFDPEEGKVDAEYTAEGVESFNDIIADPQNPDILWLCARPKGFAKFDKRTEAFTLYPPNPEDPEQGPNRNFLYVGLHDHQEEVIWLGGWEGGGLNRFDKRTETFTHYESNPNNPDSLAANAIASLYQDSEGTLWIGTLGGGLDKFDKGAQTFSHYNKEYGLPATIAAIVEDSDKNLWLSTDQGIVKFNPQTENVTVRYTQGDGLQGDIFLESVGLRTQNGELWFGGGNGVNRFRPEDIQTNPYVPPVVLTSLTQSEEPYPPGIAPEMVEEITLDWQGNFFEFEFAALNYTQPDKNRYAYILEGVDREWYEAGTRRFGRYTALEPGSYTLRIKGSNNDGLWNEEGIALKVTVIPPFWKQWWFLTLCTIGIVGIVGTLAQSRVQRRHAERKAAKALEESAERQRHVIQNMPVMMEARDEAQNILLWNRECERVTGYPAETMMNTPSALEKLYPDSRYREQMLVKWKEPRHPLRTWEEELTAADGSVKIISWSSISHQVPIPGWDEWAIGVDVTQQRAAEAEREQLLSQLQSQIHRVQLSIDTVPEGVLLLDAERHVLLANPVAERCLKILAPDGYDGALTHLGEHTLSELLTSPPTQGLWHEVNAGNHQFEIIARPMRNGTQSDDWVMVMRDVTQEREIQRRIHQQERLAAVGQLAAGIAHDFNNIMATITLYAQLATKAEGIPDHNRKQMEIINTQAHHAAHLIQQILDFSRRAIFERQPLDLLPLVKEQVQILKRTLPENITITLTYDPNIYTIKADPTRMQQMLTNLALNARDAMPEGGTLTITLKEVKIKNRRDAPLPAMPKGTWVELTLSDTGTGIPEDILPHIFEPFFTTKAPGKGSGLGLPQVYGIVEAHEGYIDVQSEVGKGTTVAIYLPAIESYETQQQDTGITSLVKGHGETILVVEDNAAARQAILDGLELLQYRVLTAANGKEGLSILEEKKDEIALILSDVVMPEMSGLTLMQVLRERNIDTSVIMMTGHPLEKALKDLEGSDAVDVIPKPITLEKLADTIARWLPPKRTAS